MLRRRTGLLLVVVLLGTCCSALLAGPFGFGKQEEQSGVQWQTDLRAAHKLAVAQQKPMLIVFGADWCGYCKKLEQETLAHPELAGYVNKTFIPVHLDADKDAKVLEILGVKGLPCSVVLNPAAEEIARIEGFHLPSAFYQKLTAANQAFIKVQHSESAK